RYLTRLRLAPTNRRAKEDVELLLAQIPAVGETMLRMGGRMKESLKHLLLPGTLFEELGFSYYGPLDGHDIATLQTTLRDAIAHGGPVLIHVVTQKGKGYRPAEENPAAYHGLGPFTPYWKAEKVEPAATVERPKPPSFSKVFASSLVALARRDPRVVAITAAMPDGTGLSAFQKAFPDRFFDVGIAEQHAVTMAAGMSTAGLRPVVAIYSTFLQRAYDQVIHDVCIQNLPVTFALDRAGLVGEDGPTHHGVFDVALLRCIPNLTVMAPKDGPELQAMLATALQLEGPAAIRYPKGSCPLPQGRVLDLERVAEPLPVGKAELLRPGADVAILALALAVLCCIPRGAAAFPSGGSSFCNGWPSRCPCARRSCSGRGRTWPSSPWGLWFGRPWRRPRPWRPKGCRRPFSTCDSSSPWMRSRSWPWPAGRGRSEERRVGKGWT